MVVSERGGRAVYNARMTDVTARTHSRQIEAVLYRRSCSKRIASRILNAPRTFRSRGLSAVPHDRFRGEQEKRQAIVEVQTLFDVWVSNRTRKMLVIDVNRQLRAASCATDTQ